MMDQTAITEEFLRSIDVHTVLPQQEPFVMIDRLVHHGHLILFDGNSYRMEHALMRQTVRQENAEVGAND